MTTRHTLCKEERISSRSQIERLFGSGSHTMSAFPLRAVYRVEDVGDCAGPSVRILVSVPKRCFKRAVKRNRVKRQLRETYRLNKHILTDAFSAEPGRQLLVAFIWTDNKLHPTTEVEAKMKKLLIRLHEAEKSASAQTKNPAAESSQEQGQQN